MGIKRTLSNTTNYVQSFINSAYDEVKAVYDSLTEIGTVADNIDSVNSVASVGDLAVLSAAITAFLATPTAAMKYPCIVATTGNITLSNLQTIDGIAVTVIMRVFVKNQDDPIENGIYNPVDGGAWVRTSDWDGSIVNNIVEGTVIPVSRGTINEATWWNVTNVGTIIVDTTGITFAQAIDAIAAAASAAAASASEIAAAASAAAAAAYDIGLLAVEQGTPNMTIQVGSGHLQVWRHLTIAGQNSATITAPITNPRIDRIAIDITDGSVVIIPGIEAGSPIAPIYSNIHYPICQIALATDTTTIINALITDERVIGWAAPNVLGASIVAATELVPGTDGNIFEVTGSEEIHSIVSLGVGTIITLWFTEIVMVDHHTTNLILPKDPMWMGSKDTMTLYEYDLGKWRMINVSRDGQGSASHVTAGNMSIDNGRIPTGAGLDVETDIAESTWVSIGPTGSGADFIWTGLDNLPKHAAILIISIDIAMSPSGTGPAVCNIYCVDGGDDTPTAANSNRILSKTIDFDQALTGWNSDFYFPVFIPLSAYAPLGVFKINWSMGSEAAGGNLGFQYRGFISGT